MNQNLNLNQSSNSVNQNLEYDIEIQALKERLKQSFDQYEKTMKFLSADAPIEILCLPAPIEKLLLSNGCLRIYDVFNLDLAKIKGLGVSRVRDLTARLDQFFSML